MRTALAESNICPARSVKQGANCRISAKSDRSEARAPAPTIYRSDRSILEAFAGVATGSRPTPIAALGWTFPRNSGINAMVAVSLIFRFGRRQNSPHMKAPIVKCFLRWSLLSFLRRKRGVQLGQRYSNGMLRSRGQRRLTT